MRVSRSAAMASGGVEVVDVDAIWRGLGKWGRFQMIHWTVLSLAIWSCGFHMLSIVFIGYRPSYECSPEPGNVSMATDASVSVTYEKCSIKTTTNVSGVLSVSEINCPNGWTYSEFGQDFAKERSIISEWDLVCDRAEFAEISQTLVMFGQGIGAFVFTSLADRFGRKPVHILCHITLFGVTLATAFVTNYTGFAVLRALMGAFQQGTGLCMAILLLETFPSEVRGYMEVTGLLFWTTGIALVTPISYIFRNMSWRSLQICLSCLSSWSLIEWFLVDESLRWLIANGKVERARTLLLKACKINKKSYDEIATASGFAEFERGYNATKEQEKATLELISKTDENGDVTDNAAYSNGRDVKKKSPDKAVKSYTVIDLVKSKRILISSLIMWFAWITNSTTYYGIMLISSSLAGNRFLNFFLGSIVEYPAAFMEFSMINRYGRKPTAITFHIICGVALVIATILHTTADGNNAMVLGSTVFTLIGKFAITGSFSTVFLYTPELYPTNMRNVGIGLSSAAARVGGMVAPFARNLAEVAMWGPGLVFGIMCAIVSILLFWVPETNKYELPQTIEETEIWYKENQFKLPWKKARNPQSDSVQIQDNNT